HWFRTSNPRQDSGPEAGPSSPRDILRKTGGGWNEQTTGSLSRKTGAGGGSSNQPGAADLCREIQGGERHVGNSGNGLNGLRGGGAVCTGIGKGREKSQSLAR